MQFCKLHVFNLVYLYVLRVLTKHFGRKQNYLKISKHRSPLKSNTKPKMKKKIGKTDKTTENERKRSKKVKEKRKKIGKRKRQR